jgi:hypothetical protein
MMISKKLTILRTLLITALTLSCFTNSSAQQVVHIENKSLAAKEDGFKGRIGLQANFIQTSTTFSKPTT